MFEGLNGRAMAIHNNVHQIQLSIMRRWTRRQTVVATGHAAMRILLARRDTLCPPILNNPDVQQARDLACLQRVVSQLGGGLTDMGPDMSWVPDRPVSQWFTDQQLDCVIRMSHVATHQYGNEFFPGGIVGAKFNLPLSTVERRLLASQWTETDEMVAAPGGHPVMTIPTICAARAPKLSIGGEIFASTGCRSKRSSYILTALISADGVPYDHPGQVLSYVEIFTDVVPAQAVTSRSKQIQAVPRSFKQFRAVSSNSKQVQAGPSCGLGSRSRLHGRPVNKNPPKMEKVVKSRKQRSTVFVA
jgi:hypothetical protein